VEEHASNTGRAHTCTLPAVKTIADAGVRFAYLDGRPIRGTRSLPDGAIPVRGLVDVEPNTKIVMTACDGKTVDARVLTTLPIR
jgi:hypothetical protein